MNRATAWGVSCGALLLVTTLSLVFRDAIGPAASSLLYVLVVIVAAGTGGGRALAAVMAVASAVSLNMFVQQPYGTLEVHAVEDGVALAVFLSVAVFTTLLVERVRAAAALEDAYTLKDTLLRAVSHELKTPLATIKASAELQAEAGVPSAARIVREADRLVQLVQDLLDWSRVGAGAMPVRPEPSVAAATLHDVSGHASLTAPNRELIVRDAGSLRGRYDGPLTARVLGLLLGNAHRYAPPGTPVELWAESSDGRLVFTVADRGPGVPPALHERVFEPFVRQSAVGDGHGLGLAIARALARAQEGDVTVHNRVGGGAEFRVSLPLWLGA